MDKNGTLLCPNVNVNLEMNGMDNTVPNLSNAQMDESGIFNINNVSVQMDHFGVDMLASLLKNVLVGNISILQFPNVFAFQDSNGMESFVSSVTMEELGMLQLYLVLALLGLSLFRVDVVSNNNAQEVKYGVKIHGLVSAQ